MLAPASSCRSSRRSRPRTRRVESPTRRSWRRLATAAGSCVFTSSFNEDWNDWATDLGHTYLPFQHELLRYVATSPDRHTIPVGDAIEEFYPPIAVGQTAALAGPESISASLILSMQDEAGAARFADTRLSGLYRIRVDGQPDSVFAVNVPEIAPGSGSESDLRRVDSGEFKTLGPAQVVDGRRRRPADDGPARR